MEGCCRIASATSSPLDYVTAAVQGNSSVSLDIFSSQLQAGRLRHIFAYGPISRASARLSAAPFPSGGNVFNRIGHCGDRARRSPLGLAILREDQLG